MIEPRFGTRSKRMSGTIRVHDPRGCPPEIVGKRLAPRLEDLDGKTVYLVDCLFDNSDVFVDQLRQWFGEHLPATDVRTVRAKESWVDDPELRSRVEADGDAAILGVGL
jgi:hypothetical protein